MFKYLYGTTRSRNYSSSLTLGEISMNGGYTTEFFNKGQFQDYEEAGIVKLSMPIPNDKYTGVLPKIDASEKIVWTVPKLTRFVMLKYSDIYTNATDLQASIEKSSSDTAVQMFATPAETIAWIKANTNLVERTPWTFVISEATTSPFGDAVTEQLLTIE